MKRIGAVSLALLLAASLTACSTPAPTPTPSPSATPSQSSQPGGSEAGVYTPGTYSGEAQGYGGPVTVEITGDGSSITDVKVTGD